MKKLPVLIIAGMALFASHIGTMAEENPDAGLKQDPSEAGDKAGAIAGLKLDASGAGYIMFGQVVSGYQYGQNSEFPTEHKWLDFYGGNIIVTSTPNDWFNAKVGLEVRSDFPISTGDIMKETYKIQYSSFLPRAEGIFHWNFKNISSLLIESGIFQYNFNPEIKNLGNYLYRGMAYPLFLETKLDYPWFDMFGIRSQVGILDDQIKVEGIINSEIKHAPFYDMSLAFTATYTAPQKIGEIGLGVCFNRLWSVDDNLTDNKSLYSTSGWDSTWTLRSTKFDSRFMFDAKPLFGNPKFFGPQDCKLYGEAALLGLTDPKYFPSDSTFRSTLLHRLPILLGINVPGFKIMDLISFEVEWFDSPYPNDWFGSNGPSPEPVYVNDPVWNDIYKNKDNFKWTVYLKKSISKFDFIGIAANDHTIYNTFNAESQSNTEQSLRQHGNWQWYVKLQYNL